jgi:2-dehydro-3-deoxygalactonokinase
MDVAASPAASPSLIGLDWGTSSLRAFLMGDGRVIETRQSGDGVQSLGGRADEFERVFAAIAGDWLAQWPALPVVACGMVGSVQGWREAPYARCPVDARTLAAHAARVASGIGPEVLIAPGVLYEPEDAAPDVMRGEETQVAGALLRQPAWAARATFLLPGTHSKWVRVEEGRIVAVATAMTGELFALLRTHSILGRLMPPPADTPDAAAFTRGVEDARTDGGGGWLHQLFAVRTLGLTERLPRAALADYLSGLLIGSELMHALAARADAAPLVLVGEPALCSRYAQALQHVGVTIDAVQGNTAPAGLWALACAAGLVRR